jgi:hypothetical protein
MNKHRLLFVESPPLSHVKLTRLAQLEGLRTKEALLHTYVREITVPGICFRSDCDGISEVPRDERAGTCLLVVAILCKAV